MVNFNATQVGLERTAAFYCDLPLGIDERQLAGNNQGALEKIVYMIASGTGKIRGAKSGGIQTVHQWRTVALATGRGTAQHRDLPDRRQHPRPGDLRGAVRQRTGRRPHAPAGRYGLRVGRPRLH